MSNKPSQGMLLQENHQQQHIPKCSGIFILYIQNFRMENSAVLWWDITLFIDLYSNSLGSLKKNHLLIIMTSCNTVYSPINCLPFPLFHFLPFNSDSLFRLSFHSFRHSVVSISVFSHSYAVTSPSVSVLSLSVLSFISRSCIISKEKN